MFRITRETDYGLILLIRLARQEDGVRGEAGSPSRGEPAPLTWPGASEEGRPAFRAANAPDLAAETGLPLPMVSKVLKRLSHAGILASHRGLHGGYALARPAQAISVAEVISALEGPIALTACLAEGPGRCDQEATCPTQGHWRLVNEVVAEALAGLTLADMVRPARTHAVAIELMASAGPVTLRDAALAAR